jgi:hypothetical protein
MRHTSCCFGSALLSLQFLFGADAAALAQELPDLERNPVSTFLESVDVTNDSAHQIRHVIDPGHGHARTVTLVSTVAGTGPHVAIETDGDSWVVWGDGATPGHLFYAKRTYSTGSWSAPMALSTSTDDSANPEIVQQGNAIRIAYDIRNGSAHTVVATGVLDTPEPIPPVDPITTVLYTGDVDIALESLSGHLWVSWADSASQVGWSESSSATGLWDLPQYESYGLGGTAVAREAIRTIVTAP